MGTVFVISAITVVYIFPAIVSLFSSVNLEYYKWVKDHVLAIKKIKTNRDIFLYLGFLIIFPLSLLIFLANFVPILNFPFAFVDDSSLKGGFHFLKDFFKVNKKSTEFQQKVNTWLDKPVYWKMDNTTKIEYLKEELKKLEEV